MQLNGTAGANWNLLLQVIMAVALLAGMVLARRRLFRAHKICQVSVVVLNVVLVGAIMVPSFREQGVLAHLIKHPGNSYYLVAMAHGAVGALGLALAVWVVLSAGTQILPQSLRLQRYKLWMRVTLALWLVAFGLGVLTYRAWYGL